MLAEAKIDSTFPTGQFAIEGFANPFRLDRNEEKDEQNSSQNEEKDEPSLFQLPTKRHLTRFQSLKPSWEPIDKNENRYACLARPDIEESYASVVKGNLSRRQSLAGCKPNLQTATQKGKQNQQEFRIQVML